MSENVSDAFKLDAPIKITGNIPEDKAVFYNAAKANLVFQSREENRAWHIKYEGKDLETTATYILTVNDAGAISGDPSRYIKSLKIVVNRGIFEKASEFLGEDCTDLIPYVVEHDIYEAWLFARKGIGNKLSAEMKHLLARRREFYLAEKDGLGDKLYQFQNFLNPFTKTECESALETARKRLKKVDINPSKNV